MVEKTVIIENRAGLHARPAAMLVQLASQYKSKISLSKDDDSINAKSIMGIITLGAGYQAELKIKAEGEDEQQAVDGIAALFESRFEED